MATRHNYTGPPEPSRVKGVEVHRGVAVNPTPGVDIKMPPDDDDEQYRYLKWASRWGGTTIEYKVFHWLESQADLVPDVDFFFQSSENGGRSIVGGAVVDFEIPESGLAFRVQGEYFHLAVASAVQNDQIQKTLIESQRPELTVVDIFESDINERLDYVMRQAMNGIQIREVRS